MEVGNQGQNFYPNPDNFPFTSFPQEVPAPDGEPDDAGTLITCQYSWKWRDVLLAAVDQLLNPATWQGTHDEKALAVARATTLKALLAVGTVPTPFWDEASDVDDEAPGNMQTWYGEVVDASAPPAELTFFEDAAIWVFTGLLAVSGTPAAAILFRTVAPKFVIAQKAGDIGEVIRIVIDAQDEVTVDTSGHAGEIIESTIVPSDQTRSFHDILIVKQS